MVEVPVVFHFFRRFFAHVFASSDGLESSRGRPWNGMVFYCCSCKTSGTLGTFSAETHFFLRLFYRLEQTGVSSAIVTIYFEHKYSPAWCFLFVLRQLDSQSVPDDLWGVLINVDLLEFYWRLHLRLLRALNVIRLRQFFSWGNGLYYGLQYLLFCKLEIFIRIFTTIKLMIWCERKMTR